MTASETKLDAASLIDAGLENIRRGLAFMAKVAIAGLLIVAAGVLAVATAFAGLIIASIALLLRFAGRRNPSGFGRRSSRRAQDSGMTLEARKTAHGWTVE